jgi:hypothetical protein
MICAAIVNVLYSAFFTVAIPWVVIPIMLCTFGMAFVSPAMTILTLDLYPSRRGMAASLQSAFVMGAFSICSGLVAPPLGGALKLACGVLLGYLASALWIYGQRHQGIGYDTDAERLAEDAIRQETPVPGLDQAGDAGRSSLRPLNDLTRPWFASAAK